MKIVSFIIGICFLVSGFITTCTVWYDAAYHGRISDASAYAGPVLIVLGALAMLRAAAAVPLPALLRMAVVGAAMLLGYGNTAAVKAAFPQAQSEVSTTNP
jgi:hypothetical protein